MHDMVTKIDDTKFVYETYFIWVIVHHLKTCRMLHHVKIIPAENFFKILLTKIAKQIKIFFMNKLDQQIQYMILDVKISSKSKSVSACNRSIKIPYLDLLSLTFKSHLKCSELDLIFKDQYHDSTF